MIKETMNKLNQEAKENETLKQKIQEMKEREVNKNKFIPVTL